MKWENERDGENGWPDQLVRRLCGKRLKLAHLRDVRLAITHPRTYQQWLQSWRRIPQGRCNVTLDWRIHHPAQSRCQAQRIEDRGWTEVARDKRSPTIGRNSIGKAPSAKR